MVQPLIHKLAIRMNKLSRAIMSCIFLMLISCNTDDCLCEMETPAWLQNRIEEDQLIIESDPDLMQNFGAWFRYEFNDEVFYEYDNPLSSLSRNPYSQEGVRIDLTEPEFANYWDERCCEKLIWKAPGYQE